MEEPGNVINQWKRVKWYLIILPSCFLLLLTILIFQFVKKDTMNSSSSVKGIIVNSAGLPVSDAVVMIKDGSHEFNDMASVSNENGEFYLSNIVIPGTYVLEIKHDDSSITREVNIQSAEPLLRINW